MRASVVISALVAVLVGFGSSLAVILAAADAVGASRAQTTSWVTVLCLSMMVTTASLSLRHRIPIVTAWSTPGAALIAASVGVTMEAAVGAFILAACLMLLTAAFRPLSDLIGRLPMPVASAMLAGVLFVFVRSLFDQIGAEPEMVLPLIALFLLLRLFSPSWAVLSVLACGVLLAGLFGRIAPVDDLSVSGLIFIAPDWDPAILLGVGIPLYLVTMASQNLPGFAVLRSADYPVPAGSILTVTGLASFATAWFGGHATNLAAITASICTGPDAHPEKEKRWLCGPFYAAGYGVLALFGASLVAVFASFPEALIASVAGLALTGPFVSALSASMADPKEHFTAAATFIVTASGISAFGLGSAFWGLCAGLAMIGLSRLVERIRQSSAT